MADITRLKEQLHHLAMEANPATGGLGGVQNKPSQSSAQVQALIALFATGADRQIGGVLDAAGKQWARR